MWFASIAFIIALAVSVLCLGHLPVMAAGIARELFASSLGFAVLIGMFGKRSWFVRDARRDERRSTSCSGRFSWS